MRTLLLLRHAQAESTRAGSTDHGRRLTEVGRRQAGELGEWLRQWAGRGGVRVDRVLCSSAVRARQTWEGLGLDVPAEQVVFDDVLSNAGGDTLLELVRASDDAARQVLVVGHAPGLPALAHELTDPATSDPRAVQAIDRQYPPCTVAVLRSAQAWASWERAALVDVRLP